MSMQRVRSTGASSAGHTRSRRASSAKATMPGSTTRRTAPSSSTASWSRSSRRRLDTDHPYNADYVLVKLMAHRVENAPRTTCSVPHSPSAIAGLG